MVEGFFVEFIGRVKDIVPAVFAAAVLKDAKEPEASKRLIAFLASEKATAAIEKMGMKRPEVSPGPSPSSHGF